MPLAQGEASLAGFPLLFGTAEQFTPCRALEQRGFRQQKIKKGYRPVIGTDLYKSSADARRTKVPSAPAFAAGDQRLCRTQKNRL